MKIKTVPLKRGRDRFAVIADGEMVIKTDYDILFTLGVFSKSELNDSELDLIKNEVELYEAKKRAYILLGYRAHSYGELVKKLKQKGFSILASERAAQHMRDMGYIDDSAYAKETAQALSRRGLGASRVMLELRARGIERDAASEAVDGLDAKTQRELALACANKKLRGAILTREEKPRMYAFLKRRGFSSDDIKYVFTTFESEESGDEQLLDWTD